jgi:hypothetical protein
MGDRLHRGPVSQRFPRHPETPLPVGYTLYTYGVSHREVEVVYTYIDTPPCKIRTAHVRRTLQGGVCVCVL